MKTQVALRTIFKVMTRQMARMSSILKVSGQSDHLGRGGPGSLDGPDIVSNAGFRRNTQAPKTLAWSVVTIRPGWIEARRSVGEGLYDRWTSTRRGLDARPTRC